MAEILLEDLGSRSKEVTLLFTDDKELQYLNSTYRSKDKPTDVLSFLSEGVYLGDIAISVQTARRQAKEYAVSLQEEILRLMIHGILHLHGYDHEGVSKAEANKMRKLEARFYEDFKQML